MAEKYFIKQYSQEEYLHGGTGPADAEKILSSLGFRPLSFPHHYNFSLKAKVSRFLFLFKMIFSIKRRSVVVFIFPVYAKMNRLLIRFLKIKNVKLICIIADIEGIRDADEMLLKTEISQLKKWKYFIVHNDKMRSFINMHIPKSVCSILYFFDFLVQPLPVEKTKGNTIVFAGNLEKGRFLSELDHLSHLPLHFNLYGPGINEKIVQYKNISYQGIHKSYDMPLLVKGSFGLVWDGESIDSCTGGYGQYLHYNSQHKLSLYILSKLPVIIWEEAATAQLVTQYNIGFTIKSIYEIEDKINALSNDEYRQMQINMQPLAERISKGQCLGKAIDEIMSEMNNQ